MNNKKITLPVNHGNHTIQLIDPAWLELPKFVGSKTAVFIDGMSTYAANKQAQQDIDYKLLLKWMLEKSHLVRASYYTTITDDGETCVLRPMVDWLEYNGFTVITKAPKVYIKDGVEKVKGNMTVEITVDALNMAKHVGHIILFSGDGDFKALVQELQRAGVRVTVISHLAVVADELRRQADNYIDLSELQAICRDKKGGE